MQLTFIHHGNKSLAMQAALRCQMQMLLISLSLHVVCGQQMHLNAKPEC